jgi:hypothetical protein
MKEMNKEEKSLVELTFSNLIDDPELEKSKTKFVKRFNRTIQSDYKDDQSASMQEYSIALWRALVDLLVHREIKGFMCSLCGQQEYINKTGMTIKFNQQYLISPCCNKLETKGIIKSPEECTEDEFKIARSVIKSIKGERKYSDNILNDKKSLIKFVSKHISNYQQQVIKENQPLKYAAQRTITVTSGMACVNDLCCVLAEYGIKFEILYKSGNGAMVATKLHHNYDDKWLSQTAKIWDALDIRSNEYHIMFDTNECDTDSIIKIMLILQKYITCGIIHTLADDRLIIQGNTNDVTSITKTFMEKVRFTKGHSGSQSNLNDSEGIDNITHGGLNMVGFGDDHENSVEMKEIIEKIYDSLNFMAKTIWCIQVQSSGFIISGEPDRYQEYASKYPGNKLNNTDLADYLGTNTRTVKRCREEIETQCFYHGLG